jgi:hypothetical protein
MSYFSHQVGKEEGCKTENEGEEGCVGLTVDVLAPATST